MTSSMKYFKKDGDVYAYDLEQIALGFASDKIEMTADEVESHTHRHKTHIKIDDNWDPMRATSDLKSTEDDVVAKLKSDRAAAIRSLTVETKAGNTFDADEPSQLRMAITINNMLRNKTKTINWVLSDNRVANITIKELIEAADLANTRLSELWVLPYQDDANEPDGEAVEESDNPEPAQLES